MTFIARDITDRKRAEELESQNVYLQEELQVERSFGEIVGQSPAMRQVFRAIERVADTEFHRVGARRDWHWQGADRARASQPQSSS